MQLALGTVQFGLAYGIAGNTAAVPDREVRAILEDAVSSGVRILDTAAAYGDIEDKLGELISEYPFQVISKVPAIPKELSATDAVAWALSSAQRSLDRLGLKLTGLMLHRASDLGGVRGEQIGLALSAWCVRHGLAFGASCYDADQASRLCLERGIRLAQLPGNALDQRVATAVQTLAPLDVHMRSVFLQGLLLMPLDQAVRKIPAATQSLRAWHQRCADAGLHPLEAALGLVKSFRAVSTVLVGVNSLQQWREIAAVWAAAPELQWPELACIDPCIIDPRHWNQNP